MFRVFMQLIFVFLMGLAQPIQASIILNTFEYNDNHTSFFYKTLLNTAYDCICHNDSAEDKEELTYALHELKNNSGELCSEEFSLSSFYKLHSIFQHLIACYKNMGEIEKVVGVIHAQSPAAFPGKFQESNCLEKRLDQFLHWNLGKLFTYQSEEQTLYELLHLKSRVYFNYPSGSYNTTPFQKQCLYNHALRRFRGLLLDRVLYTDSISDEMIGSLYLFTTSTQETYALILQKKKQSNKMWIGPLSNPVIEARVNSVCDYLHKTGGTDIRKEFR